MSDRVTIDRHKGHLLWRDLYMVSMHLWQKT